MCIRDRALTNVLNAYGRKIKLLKDDEKVSGEDCREGLTCVISVKLTEDVYKRQQFSEVGTIAQFGEIGTLYYDIFDREEGIRIITEKPSTGDFRKTVAVYSGDPEEKLSVVIYENYEGTFQKIVRQRLWFYDLLQVPEET